MLSSLYKLIQINSLFKEMIILQDARIELSDSIERVLTETIDEDKIGGIRQSIFVILRDYEIHKAQQEFSVGYEEKNNRTIERYKRVCEIENKTKRTIKEYERVIRNFAKFIDKDLMKTKSFEIIDYLGVLKENGNDSVTVRNVRNVLSAFFLFLEGEESIEKNPIRSIRKIKVDEKIKLPFTDIEVEELKNACTNVRNRAIIEILLSSGIRCSELVNLKVADLDTSTLQLKIIAGKGNKDRIVFISKVANKYLQEYLRDRKLDSEYLFTHSKGSDDGKLTENAIGKIINSLGKRAGVKKAHPHRFRRTFATNCIKRGMPLQELQKLLGHANINVTMKYVFVENGTLKGSYEKYV